METIYILWLRQLKRYFRSRSRIIGALGQPLLFLVAFGFGFGPIFQRAGEGNYIQFIAPGIIAMSIMFTAVFAGIEVIWDKQFGFLKETLVAPVPRLQIVTGKVLGGATVALFQGFVVLAITLLVGFRPVSWQMAALSPVYMFLIGLMFSAFGTAIASVFDDMQAFPLITNFLVMPMFFLGGALFPLSGLPGALETVARLDPFAYGIDGLHGTLTVSAHFGLGTDALVLVVITAGLFAIGSWLFERIQV